MAKKALTAMGMASHGIVQAPSKGQASFSTLVGKIEKRRATLAEWEAFDAIFRRRYNDELSPLRQRFDATRAQLVRRLDRSHDIKSLTRPERQTIAELIGHIAGDLLASVDDPAIAEIYRRYNASLDGAGSAAFRDARDAAPGTPDADVQAEAAPGSAEDVLRHVQEHFEQQDERERMHREAREAYHARRKKKPKRDAAEERARAEEAETHLSIREVYRKLASVLHPDREPDPVERERKAALMQRVNQAYASKSLLDLLELQLELEHIDRAQLDNVGEDRLERWNTILKEQLRRLDRELVDIEVGYRARCGMSASLAVSPKTVKRALTAGITSLRDAVRTFEQDLRAFDDVNRLKLWLKDMKRELAAQGSDDTAF
ncbi:MAG TPA: J domain-containing protein [Luteibacter sp.]|uniref:J domain-containing protein n=1 Tax=Luteibacter sp. TaxID=1886636 RepID=UPI002BED5F02|nr:J domain-containing protein [Luteibacter sp.]HVI56640.1 J domain-containing protein [Luteibacter sp.]